MTKGWKGESARHALASKGVKTGRKKEKILNKIRDKSIQPFALKYSEVKKGTGESYQYDSLGQFYPKEEGGEEVGKIYQEKYKGKKTKIEWMSPDEYFDRLGFKQNEAYVSKKRVDELTHSAKNGDKFAMPWIEIERYKGKIVMGHEGKHRVMMAKKLGIKKIPVVVVKKDKRYADVEGWVRGKYKKVKK